MLPPTRKTHGPRPDWESKMEAWKEVPLIDCNTTSKKVGIKAWHWCKHHMAFTIQKLQDCKIGSNNHRASKHCQGSFQELLMEEDDNISCIKALLASIYAKDDDHKWKFVLAWLHMAITFLTADSYDWTHYHCNYFYLLLTTVLHSLPKSSS